MFTTLNCNKITNFEISLVSTRFKKMVNLTVTHKANDF